MKLKVKLINLETGDKPVVILNHDDVEELGVHSLGRVKLLAGEKELTAIVNTTRKVLKRGELGVLDEVKNFFNLTEGAQLDVEAADFPTSLKFIRNRLKGRNLTYSEIEEIISDIVKGRLSEVEITAFVMALENYGLNMDEAASLSTAMVETGERLNLDSKVVVDKHSIGGVPGDKTTLLVVPIIAACGLAIPKSSSRAITSAAGTADRAEVLMNVNLETEEMRRVVNKTNGCIAWGGALHMAPADDIFVKIEYPLSIDPLLLPSIMSKKKAVGATHLVVDIPAGRGTKVKTLGDADLLAKDFIELGKKLEIKTQCAITYGEQPIGHAIGPALEAREALSALMRREKPYDLLDKATHIAGILLEMFKAGNGQQKALEVVESGKAENKLREIIAEQGGDPKVKPEDINIGQHRLDVYSKNEGYVFWVNSAALVEIARAAGSPRDKGAGIVLYKKYGNRVSPHELLLTIYAEKAIKMQKAQSILEEGEWTPVKVGQKMDMLIEEVKEMRIADKAFILER